jgi:hypothetical protein
VPEGTVLARAKREGWTQQIELQQQNRPLSYRNQMQSHHCNQSRQ